ncbi:MAG: DNA-directed RNA polymerase subunit alpha C-terminal domain-containing protein [Candidatus Caenarcaniphilales bacterium]|nr:DNA-directed RNA polymerase subunit alpha C-terminal domain-containing protein [Candidatus Caenarcaniphilales bacterium]
MEINKLIRSFFKDIESLVDTTLQELKDIKGLGAKSLKEIQDALSQIGLSLRS